MFPLNSNLPYIKDDGTRDKLGNVIGSGGGGGGSANIYHGTTLPTDDLGAEGDTYLYISSTGVMTNFTLNITGALRGDTVANYAGAMEIQLFFTKNGVSKNILEFPEFHCEGSPNIDYAFNGNTGGSYWEQQSLPITVTFGALVPSDWILSKLEVWQRSGGYNNDVWSAFSLTCNDTVLLNKNELTQSDWAGAGYGTEFNITTQPYRAMVGEVFYKVDMDDVVKWIC